jgi:hypothetical protein
MKKNIAILLSLCASSAFAAEPVYQVQGGDIKVLLYKEPCALKSSVSNLPYRATWEEKGKKFEGCFGVDAEMGLVITYFSDKSVVVLPLSALVKVRSA